LAQSLKKPPDNPKIEDYEAFPELQNINISYKRVEFCCVGKSLENTLPEPLRTWWEHIGNKKTFKKILKAPFSPPLPGKILDPLGLMGA
jgi:hypothetical protein